MNVFSVFLVVVLLVHVMAQGESLIRSVKYNYTCNKNYMIVDIQDNKKRNDLVFNMSFDGLVPFTQLKLISSFALPENHNDLNFKYSTVKTSVDICRFGGGVTTNWFYKVLLDLLFSSQVGEPFSCPTIIGKTVMTNCNVSSIQIPHLVPETKFKLTFRLFGKTPKVQKLIKLLDVVITAEYRR